MNSGVRHVTVADATGQRIDNFLIRELKGVPRTRIYRMLRSGEVRLDGRRVKPSARVVDGQVVRIPPVRSPDTSPPARLPGGWIERLQAAVVFEDDELLVLDKPAGIAVHGGSGIRSGVIETLRQMRSNPRLELGHRLDRDTSGILMIGKTRAALARLHDGFRAGAVVKRYQALVVDRWPRSTRTVRLRLRRYVTGTGERRVRVDSTGQSARTDIEILRTGVAASWLDIGLHTGRTHQIRVHATATGHPVLGDDKYATPESRDLAIQCGVQRLCLHARELRLPWDDGIRRFSAPVPEEFEVAWKALERVAD